MTNGQPHISIIMLNWNGWRDTIECLESLLKCDYSNYQIILIDNSSQDDSLSRIRDWASGKEVCDIDSKFPSLVLPLVAKPVTLIELDVDGEGPVESIDARRVSREIVPRSVILVRNRENSGFAIANNIGVRIAGKLFASSYYYLLNNDTVSEADSITRMVEAFEENSALGAASAAIYYYSNPEKIANLGGKLTFLARRKYYSSYPKNKKRRVTFVTGCALMVRAEIFKEYGLLSENFFFGEEDFEFSWRLRKQKVPVDCIQSSRVYHKVSVSANKMYDNNLRKQFLFIFTRIVNMRAYFSYWVWQVWRHFILMSTFFWLIAKYKVSSAIAAKFVLLLRQYSDKYRDAKRTTVEIIYRDIGF